MLWKLRILGDKSRNILASKTALNFSEQWYRKRPINWPITTRVITERYNNRSYWFFFSTVEYGPLNWPITVRVITEMYNHRSYYWVLEKYKEWQELVPQLISGNIEKLSAVVDAHHRKEKMMASLRSRYISKLLVRTMYTKTRHHSVSRSTHDLREIKLHRGKRLKSWSCFLVSFKIKITFELKKRGNQYWAQKMFKKNCSDVRFSGQCS